MERRGFLAGIIALIGLGTTKTKEPNPLTPIPGKGITVKEAVDHCKRRVVGMDLGHKNEPIYTSEDVDGLSTASTPKEQRKFGEAIRTYLQKHPTHKITTEGRQIRHTGPGCYEVRLTDAEWEALSPEEQAKGRWRNGAHSADKPDAKAEELAQCQRYYQKPVGMAGLNPSRQVFRIDPNAPKFEKPDKPFTYEIW
jgi:hypothetical protein